MLAHPAAPSDRPDLSGSRHAPLRAGHGRERLWHSDADAERIFQLDRGPDLAFDNRHLWQIAGRPKRIVVVEPEDGRLVRDVSLGPHAENACGLHVDGGRYWIGWKGEASIEERDLASNEGLVPYAATPRIAGLTRRAEALTMSSIIRRFGSTSYTGGTRKDGCGAGPRSRIPSFKGWWLPS